MIFALHSSDYHQSQLELSSTSISWVSYKQQLYL